MEFTSIQGETIPIHKKQKCIVAHMKDSFWWGEHEIFVEPPYVNLYSVNDIWVNEGKLSIKFSYQNGPMLELEGKEIVAFVPFRKKAKREDEDIQQILSSISDVQQ